MSRPEKPIDWKRVDELLMAGCLGTEIASHFDMHHETFYNRIQQQYGMGFTAYCSEKRAKGDSLLRETQYKKALKNDNSMLIWLGKQRLEQREPDQRSIQTHDVTIKEATEKVIDQITKSHEALKQIDG